MFFLSEKHVDNYVQSSVLMIEDQKNAPFWNHCEDDVLGPPTIAQKDSWLFFVHKEIVEYIWEKYGFSTSSRKVKNPTNIRSREK